MQFNGIVCLQRGISKIFINDGKGHGGRTCFPSGDTPQSSILDTILAQGTLFPSRKADLGMKI